ncbi:hypothetical protein B0T20DRAFT_152699 [Sordaria brevicollis]|uniref:Rhodopsin domain-containing protein n=1 Tax=Sordaria brevicollis TaxID=83679 RepID=A0AAE0UE57_SORBR|nr:hypothetical protein B0T20DRAFT_152699 [Sordaria brevicollis]
MSNQGVSEDYLRANKGPEIIVIIVTIVSISTAFVFARLFVRTRILGKLEVDDFLILLGAACAWICVGMTIVSIHYGFGKHASVLDLDDMQQMIKWTFFSFTPSILAFTIPKFAVVSLLTRLLNPSKWHRVFLWVLVGTCQVAILGCAIILFAQCTPTVAQWDFSIENKKCWSPWVLVKYSMVAGCFSALTDLYLAVYPTIVLFKLQINRKKKAALCFALGIGSVSAIVSVYKSTRLPSLAGEDFSWDTTDLVIWSLIEGSTIIIASCIPLLQPLLDVLLGRRTLCSTPQSGGYKSGYGRHTTRDGYHKQSSKLNDVELEAGTLSKNKSQLRSKTDPDDDLLKTVIARVDSETGSATEVGENGYNSQESILNVKGQQGVQVQGQPQQVGNGIDRSRSSAGTVMGVAISGNGNGASGGMNATQAPAGMIMRTQEVTMTVETHNEFGGHGQTPGNGGDLPAYPARAARW